MNPEIRRAIAGAGLSAAMLVAALCPTGVVHARPVQAIPPVKYGPEGGPITRGPGATTYVVVVDRTNITAGALRPADLREMAVQTFNYDARNQLVTVPVLQLGSGATPNVRAAIDQVARLNPMQVYLLGMTEGQRLTLITNAINSGPAIFVNAAPGRLTSILALRAAVRNAAYYTPALVRHTAGLRPPTTIPDNIKLHVPAIKAPPAADLSAGLPPVRDQGNENSCVGWSTSYYYKTWQEGRIHRWDVNVLSHQFSPSFIYNQINGGKDQGSLFYDAMALVTQKGDVPLSVFPYLEGKYLVQPSAQIVASADPYRAKSFGYIFLHTSTDAFPFKQDITPLKRWLASGNPFVVGMILYPSFMSYTGGVYNGPYKSDPHDPEGGHAMMVVGYDDNALGTGIGAFRLVNSWGPGWGQHGFGWVSYSYFSHYVDAAWAMQANPHEPAPTTLAPYPNPGANGAGQGVVSYSSFGKFSLATKAGSRDSIATITFEYQSSAAPDDPIEDHLYTERVTLRPGSDVTITQNYRMDDGAVVTGQVEIVTDQA